jgi:DNA polymerase-3 subunit delta
VHGTDEALVSHALADLVRRLVGRQDRSLVVTDVTVDGEEVTAGHVVSEAQTPPFLTDKRVVVVRDVQRLDADGLGLLIAYLAAPLDTTDLVLVHPGKPTKKLLDAVRGSGGQVTGADVGANRKDRAAFVEEQIAAGGLRLTSAAETEVVDQLGEDLNRLAGVIDTIVAAFGPGARLDADDIAPYLGDGGGIPPWDLTDAIDKGDREAALEALARMLRAGGRHPLVIMAILHNHYGRLLRLEGSGATDEGSAGEVLGVKGFVARKALDRVRAMGPEAIHDAIDLLANADADLRGRRELPEDAVLEVLVARLCRLSRTRQPARRR